MTTHDVVVIGAGPAGLAASGAAADAGLDVALLDAEDRPGGQYYRQHGTGPVPHHRVTHLPRHRVWHVERGFTAHAVADERPRQVRGRALVIATGAHDRPLPFPGWDLPGVLTAGGAQALVKGELVVPGNRVVVAGTGPFLLPVAAALARGGADVPGVFEANRPLGFARHLAHHPEKAREAAGYAAALARHRIPYLLGRAVVEAHGHDAVTAVTVATLDRAWRPVRRRIVPCDAVAVGYGFTPRLEIPLQLGCATRLDDAGSLVAVVDTAQRTSVPGVYAAGETTGVGGAQLAHVEGELAGRAVAEALGAARRPEHARRLLARRRTLRAFAEAMNRAFPVRAGWTGWPRQDTIVCRCEEVTRAGLAEAAALGATDPRTAKLLSRAGMGRCQGRICGYATAWLIAGREGPDADGLRGLATRPVAEPVLLRHIATEEEDRQ